MHVRTEPLLISQVRPDVKANNEKIYKEQD